MDKVKSKLTVFFEEPFWVGVFEYMEGNQLSVCKVTFGTEPRPCELYEFILGRYHHLQLNPAVAAVVKERKKNPKRVLREVKKQLEQNGSGTKSQQALKLQQERFKIVRKQKSRMQKEAEAQHRFELKQQKKKDKHRGR